MPVKSNSGTTPLLRTCSVPSVPSSRTEGMYKPEEEKPKRIQNNNTTFHPYGDLFVDNLPHPDITAMSILSLYEKQNEQSCSEMDTNR